MTYADSAAVIASVKANNIHNKNFFTIEHNNKLWVGKCRECEFTRFP